MAPREEYVKALYFVIQATLQVSEGLQIHPPSTTGTSKVSTALALADTYLIIWNIV
jgi:hypothetical protein